LYLKSIFKYFFFDVFPFVFWRFFEKVFIFVFVFRYWKNNSDFKYKYILFKINKCLLFSHPKFYSVVPGGVRNGKFLILIPLKKTI
jgi:hypothetical protein